MIYTTYHMYIFRKDFFIFTNYKVEIHGYNNGYDDHEQLIKQGFVFIESFGSHSYEEAKKYAESIYHSIIGQLNSKISELTAEIEGYKSDCTSLFKAFTYEQHLNLLGFTKRPTKEELEQRKKDFLKITHPDKIKTDVFSKIILDSFNRIANDI